MKSTPSQPDHRPSQQRLGLFSRFAATTAAIAAALCLPMIAASPASAAIAATTPGRIASPTDFANAFLNAIPEPDTPRMWQRSSRGSSRKAATGTTRPASIRWTPPRGSRARRPSTRSGCIYEQAARRAGNRGDDQERHYPGVLSALQAGTSATAVAQAVTRDRWSPRQRGRSRLGVTAVT